MNSRLAMLLSLLCCMHFSSYSTASQNQKRNRGESFYHCMNSNTPGVGNLWLSLSILGHIWDNVPEYIQETESSGFRWVSNIRAFPELYGQGGITDFFSIHTSSRVLSYGFKPGWFKGGIKITWPNNQDLRLHGFGFAIDYVYQTRETTPTLSGAIGFMPEGFVVKGHNLEMLALHELDLLPLNSLLSIRFLTNLGVRLPLTRRSELFQYLATICAVYSGYGFDFFAQYSLEAFNNILKPILVKPQKFMVAFSENPMYITLGGNIRYNNGITLSLSVPILLSVNWGSRKHPEDEQELIDDTQEDLFRIEKDHGVRLGFDPWYVKWKICGTLTFPIKFEMTGTEMRRNFLILKNRKKGRKIDIDDRLQFQQKTGSDEEKEKEDEKQRLEKIKKKREELLK